MSATICGYTWLSWVFAAKTPTTNRTLSAPESTCSFKPYLPLPTCSGRSGIPSGPDAGHDQDRQRPVKFTSGAEPVEQLLTWPKPALAPRAEPPSAVADEPRNGNGRSRRAHPEVSTNAIAAKAARSPPPAPM